MIRELFLSDFSLSSCVWQSTIFLVVGLVSSFILRHRSSRAHQVLFLAMIAAVIVPMMSILVKHYELGVFVAEPIAIQSPAEDLTGGSNYGAPGIISAENIEHKPGVIEKDLPSAMAGSEGAKFPWRSIVLSGWIAVSLILFARLLVTFVLGARLLGRALPLKCERIEEALNLARAKLGIDKDVMVRSSRGVRSPVIWCWRKRPILLVPSAAGRLDNGVDWAGVLCHELAHWKRRDHISGLLAELAACILPWHPLLWWAKSRLVRLSEQACDDWVVATGQPCTDYAESLLDLVPCGQMAFVPAVVRSKKGLPGRIQRILQDSCDNPRTGALWALTVSIVAVCLAVGVAFAKTRPASIDKTKTEAPPVPKALKNNVLPVDWRLDYDNGIRPDGGKSWLSNMAQNLASLKVVPKRVDPNEEYKFNIHSLQGKEMGSVYVRPGSKFGDQNLKILKPDKYLLRYAREWGKPGYNFRMRCGEFLVDLSQPGMYELKFTPKLGAVEITGSLGGCYAINFEKVGKGPWIRGFAYQHGRPYLLDGLPAGKYRLSAVTQRQSDNVFVSQAEVTVGAEDSTTVNMAPAPIDSCSLKGNILGKQKKYKTPWPKTWPESEGKWFILIRKPGSGVIENADAYEALTMDSLYVVRGSNIKQETKDRYRYNIEGLVPGKYTVTAIEHPWWSGCVITRQQSKPLTLRTGDEAVLDFDLRDTHAFEENTGLRTGG